MQLIGYTCSYIPVELLALTGFRPYRLLHGDVDSSKRGEKFVRVDACPMVKSNLDHIFRNQNDFAALVGSTGCDMSRRMLDVAAENTRIPVLVFNNPRTDNRTIFHDEIDWLTQRLERLSRRQFNPASIQNEVTKWESMRVELRTIDERRAANPSQVSTASFHEVMTAYCQGAFDRDVSICRERADRPRVYLLGSAITYESNAILRLIEDHLRIVGDFNCGLSRALDIRIQEPTLAGIEETYYGQPPCVFKRPDRRFIDHVRDETRRLNCTGVVAWTLDYCDAYEFELRKIERTIDLPVLRIRSDFSLQGSSQLRTRIEAFVEMLCSKT
ncbi:2-hydroxyacyl-CoA dehydratase [candidate division WOR-3 bacterium]|nr:2-hydroxyacyl-CoA dehydratase [candidate division WOR-3 bacterium]